MALVPIAKQGNFLHIYDFKVDPEHVDDFIRLFNQFDYSDANPMHKSPAQVKDGANLRAIVFQRQVAMPRRAMPTEVRDLFAYLTGAQQAQTGAERDGNESSEEPIADGIAEQDLTQERHDRAQRKPQARLSQIARAAAAKSREEPRSLAVVDG